jgi:insulysin
LEIELTEEGLSHIDTAIALSYEAIAKVKQMGIPLSTFQEIQTMAKLRYQYQSREDAFSWITDMTRQLMDESLETFPEKTKVPSSFDPEALMQLTSFLNPDSCLYMLIADPEKIGVITDRKETWMQVPYKIEPIAPSKLSAWKQITPTHNIELPASNPFLPSSLEILTIDGVSLKEAIPSPTKIFNNEKMIGYFGKDDRYLVPEISYLFTIKTPAINGSASSVALGDLMTKALIDEFSSTLFFASHAGLSCNLSAKNLGFMVQISGYSEKAPELTQEVFRFLKEFTPSKEKFSVYKDSLLSLYANGAAELPVKQAIMTAYDILLNDSPTPAEKEEALKNISWDDFSTFFTHWLDTVYIESMIYGNQSADSAKNMLSSIAQQFDSSLAYEHPLKQALLQLPSNGGPFKVMQKTERQGNGAVLVIEEGPFSFSKKASQKILSVLLQQHFFDTLRTKQQTGYIAQAWAAETDKQLLQLFAVQSSTHLPEDLLHRFELFLEDFCKKVSELVSEEEFKALQTSQITALEMPPENLPEMAGYLNLLAFDKDADFSYKQKLISALGSLSYAEFLQDTEEFLFKGNTRRLAVLMEGEQLSKPLQYAEIAKEDIVKAGTYSSR